LAALAGVTVVAAVAIAALPAHAADGPGAITGHLVDGVTPIAQASVTLYDTDYNYVTWANTGLDGGFTLSNVPAGSYKVSFSIAGGFTQWVARKASFQDADLVTVAAGETTTVEEAVRPYGGLTGRVTTADGTPAASVRVNASTFDGDGGGGSAVTDADGRYTITYLDAVDYRVSFQRDYHSPVQYAKNATSYRDATPISVSIGAPTTLDQTLLVPSSITGVVTAGGSPVAGVAVYTSGPGDVSGGSGYTDGDGRYEVSEWPGSYKIQFSRPDGLTEYAPRQIDWYAAGRYDVAVGAATVVDEELLATGTITGRLLTADGAAVPYAGVHAHAPLLNQWSSVDFGGRYSLTVFPGSYTLAFDTTHGTQWATGRSSGALADPITVDAGATVVVDEVLNPYGSIEVTAADRKTGAALMSFCANVERLFSGCTDTGTLAVPEVLPGRHVVSAYPPENTPEEFVADAVVAEVASGSATSVRLPVTPGGSVSTVITDAVTGNPVAGACLALALAERPSVGGATGGGFCSDAAGKVRVPLVAPGSYYAFVSVRDGVHGHQWVGRHGGVGTVKKAEVIKVKAGESVTLAPVRLDPAGSISGLVADEATGEPLHYGFVGLNPYNIGAGGPTGFDVQIDHQGRYTMRGLGPYAWSLYFSNPGSSYAGEWSGDTANRDKALGIRVRAGETTRYDTALGAGTLVTGTVYGPTGAEADGGRIAFVSTAGDELDVGSTYMLMRPYVARVKGPVKVKVEYSATVGAQEYEGWVGGTGFADASTLSIPAGGQITYNVTATTPWP
jgi:hypothetical protein